jgi:hypothetical protein
MQEGQLLLESLPTTAVELIEELFEELLIFLAAGKIPASPQHQGLINGLLETMMTLFNIAVLMRAARLYLLAFKAVVAGQTPVLVGEDLWIADLVDGTGQIIGSVVLSDSAELPERVLQTRTETFAALREAVTVSQLE